MSYICHRNKEGAIGRHVIAPVRRNFLTAVDVSSMIQHLTHAEPEHAPGHPSRLARGYQSNVWTGRRALFGNFKDAPPPVPNANPLASNRRHRRNTTFRLASFHSRFHETPRERRAGLGVPPAGRKRDKQRVARLRPGLSRRDRVYVLSWPGLRSPFTVTQHI